MTPSLITSVCYHYLKRSDEFRRIWGHDFDVFKEHISFFQKEWTSITLDFLEKGISGSVSLPPQCSILTFDDGLKEHATIIGPYLADRNISAVFNVCTDVLLKKEPTIAQTIHFGTAYLGIRQFSQIIIAYIKNEEIRTSFESFMKSVESKPLLEIHSQVKYFFNKNGIQQISLEIMRSFWHAELEKRVPDIFEKVFMNTHDVKKLISLGHTIGLHTASHAHITDEQFTPEFIQNEIIQAKKDLEAITEIPIRCFTYPFGHKEGTLHLQENRSTLMRAGFEYVFTTYFDGNHQFDPSRIGRYLSQSRDSIDVLQSRLWSYEVSHNHKQSPAS